MQREVEDPNPGSVVSTRRCEIVGIDLLRFVAALMVMLFHLGFWSWAAPQTRTNILLGDHAHFPRLAPLASIGWVGVEIFFVISGFVITRSAQEGSVGAFVKNRFLRLAPGAWICSTLTVSLAVAFAGVDWHALAWPYLRTLAFFPMAPWVDDAYWTLDVEVAFYALIALVLLFGDRHRIGVIAATLGVASATFWCAHAFAVEAGNSKGPTFFIAVASSRFGDLALIKHGCFFCIGSILHDVMGRRATRTSLAIGIFCAIGGLLEIDASAARTALITGYDDTAIAPMAAWGTSMVAILLSIRFNRFLGGLPLAANARRIGLATYPLYLLHTLLGSIVIRQLVRAGADESEALILAFLAIIGLAFLVSEYCEPLARRTIARTLEMAAARMRASGPFGPGALKTKGLSADRLRSQIDGGPA